MEFSLDPATKHKLYTLGKDIVFDTIITIHIILMVSVYTLNTNLALQYKLIPSCNTNLKKNSINLLTMIILGLMLFRLWILPVASSAGYFEMFFQLILIVLYILILVFNGRTLSDLKNTAICVGANALETNVITLAKNAATDIQNYCLLALGVSTLSFIYNLIRIFTRHKLTPEAIAQQQLDQQQQQLDAQAAPAQS